MGIILNDSDISKALDEELEIMSHVEGQYIATPNDYFEEVAHLASYGDIQAGDDLPWENSIFRVRRGELSIWAGVNGHGKSLILGMLMLWIAKTQKILIASLEMKPEQTLYRTICQQAGCKASPDYSRKVLSALQGKFYIYAQLDTVASDRILAMVHYAAKTLKVDHIVIDSLMKCGIAHEDYSGEKTFVDRLQQAAKRYNVHIHLVCHVRKKSNEAEIPNKYDIKGNGAITDLADNVFIVWRNKIREEAKKLIQKGMGLSTIQQKMLDLPDSFLCIDKNRHGGKEGKIGLYYHESSGQYTRQENKVMIPPFGV